jgi:hypothetical protein
LTARLPYNYIKPLGKIRIVFLWFLAWNAWGILRDVDKKKKKGSNAGDRR